MGTFVEPLDPNTPADSDLASSGDDAMRQKTRAIIERLESFFVDIDANPLVPINPIVTILTGTLEIDMGPVATVWLGPVKVREFDIDVPGAKAGDPARAEWEPDLENSGWPTPPANPPVTSEEAANGLDLTLFHAWCIDDDKVRVHVSTTTNIGSDGQPRIIRATVTHAATAE